jgi:putative transposase
MKASEFSDAQRALILKQGTDSVSIAEICRKTGISQATYFDWEKRYDDLLLPEMRRLKQLEDENAKLKRLLADAMLDNVGLKDLLSKTFRRPPPNGPWSSISGQRSR